MAYTPVNIDTYTNAFAGALAGMAISGWIIDPNSADYANVATIAGAFAEAFDTVWNNATTLNSLQAQAIQSICHEQFANHAPGSLDNQSFTQPSNWAVPAAACAALVLQGDAYVASEGITPSTPGGGGGGQVAHTRYVDAFTTVPLADQDGSFGAPFALAASAIAALQAIEAAGAEGAAFCMMVWPGNYAAEGNLAWEPTFNTSTLSIVGANGLNFVPDVNINQIPIFESISTANDGFLSLKGIIVGGAAGVLANGGLDVQGCQLWNVCESGLASRFLDSYMVGVACVMGGGSFSGGRIQAGSFTMPAGNDLTLLNCQYEGTAITIAGAGGSLRVDATSNYWVIETAPTLTGVTKVVQASLAP